MNNLDREIVASLHRYGKKHGIGVRTHSHDWIVELTFQGRVHYVFGYDLGLNASTTHRLCNDKAATWEVLNAHGIAAIPHDLFLHPRWLDYIAIDGNWSRMLDAFNRNDGDVVIKDNEGTGGREVLRATSVRELEQAATTIFETARSLAISPYVDIQVELRFVLLEGAPLLAYAKDRPVVVGDGKRTIGELIADLALPPGVDQEILAEIAPVQPVAHVPDPDEIISVQWRHNLGKGGQPRMLDIADQGIADAMDLARAAAAHTNLRFGSVDIAVVNSEPHVLEINSGVMLEHLSKITEDGPGMSDRIYHAVLDRIFERTA